MPSNPLEVAPDSGPPLTVVMGLREDLLAGFRNFYREHGVPEARAPLLVGVTGACENVDTLIAVTSTDSRREQKQSPDSTYLSQTGQLSLETALTHVGACWCHTISFRDDHPDSRHLREFELIEEEFSVPLPHSGGTDADASLALFERLLDRIETVLQTGIRAVLTSNTVDLFRADVGHLELASEHPCSRITYDDALELANVTRRHSGLQPLSWGQDLQPRDEQAVIAELSTVAGPAPIIVTLFPAEIKFFNMKLDPRDMRRVLSADLLLPFAGEAIGAAVREDDYVILERRLSESSMLRTLVARDAASLADFEPYLEPLRDGAIRPHAGYGIGLDRVLQFIVRGSDIRATSIASRLGGQFK